MKEISSLRNVHVAGVGGVGMNAVAQVLLGQGIAVSGSDRFLDQGKRVPVLDQLEGQGVQLCAQDGSGITADTDALVISTAVEADNPDRVKAKELGVEEWHRAEVLAAVAGQGDLIAITGTSGKTTCTAMLGWYLEQAGLEPNVVNGGALVNWRSADVIGNVRLAKSPGLWVMEVDESDKSLLRFRPKVAVVTTITADHFDLEESIALFRQFASQVSDRIVCGPGVKTLLEGATEAELIEVDRRDWPQVSMPGVHNRLNAAMMQMVAGGLQAPDVDWRGFKGVERRLECHSAAEATIAVYDDYGHNAEKIAAGIRTIQEECERLWAVWRPHGYAPLLNNLDELETMFVEALRERDELLLLPVFFAGGTADRSQDSDVLVARLKGRGVKVRWVRGFEEAQDLLVTTCREGDAVLSMGARDPGLPEFARGLGEVLGRTG